MQEENPKPVIFLETPSMPQALKDLRSQYEKTPGVQVFTVKNSRECHVRVQDAGRAVILFSINSKEELAEVLAALVRVQAETQAGVVRTLGFNLMNNEKVEPALRQKGCSEILAPNTNARALQHKMTRWLTIVETAFAKVMGESGDASASGAAGKGDGKSQNSGAAAAAARMEWVPALKLETDFFLIKEDFVPKQVMKQWSVEVLAPGPAEGKWKRSRMSGLPPEGTPWEWVAHKTESLFNTPDGRWIFFGREPDFSEQTLRWRFAGERLHLGYFQEGNLKGSRFKVDEKVIQFAKNSVQAEQLRPMIEATLDEEVKLTDAMTKKEEKKGEEEVIAKAKSTKLSSATLLDDDEDKKPVSSTAVSASEEAEWGSGKKPSNGLSATTLDDDESANKKAALGIDKQAGSEKSASLTRGDAHGDDEDDEKKARPKDWSAKKDQQGYSAKDAKSGLGGGSLDDDDEENAKKKAALGLSGKPNGAKTGSSTESDDDEGGDEKKGRPKDWSAKKDQGYGAKDAKAGLGGGSSLDDDDESVTKKAALGLSGKANAAKNGSLTDGDAADEDEENTSRPKDWSAKKDQQGYGAKDAKSGLGGGSLDDDDESDLQKKSLADKLEKSGTHDRAGAKSGLTAGGLDGDSKESDGANSGRAGSGTGGSAKEKLEAKRRSGLSGNGSLGEDDDAVGAAGRSGRAGKNAASQKKLTDKAGQLEGEAAALAGGSKGTLPLTKQVLQGKAGEKSEELGEEGVPLAWDILGDAVIPSIAIETQSGIRHAMRFLDLLDRTAIVQTAKPPRWDAQADPAVKLILRVEHGKKSLNFNFSTTQIHSEKNAQGDHVLSLGLPGATDEQLQQLTEAFVSRWENILGYFHTARGVGPVPEDVRKIDAEEKGLLRKYFQGKWIFIVDASKDSRARCKSLLESLGADASLIAEFSEYAEAVAQLPTLRPHVIFTDYFFGVDRGHALLALQRQFQPDQKQSLFIVTTAESLQESVARVAATEVDGYLLKPVNVADFEGFLVRIAVEKFFPSPYIRMLEEGLRFVTTQQHDLALACFTRAMDLDPKPSQACYLHARTSFQLGQLVLACQGFERALSFDKLHFLSLMGLFDVHMAEKRRPDAYSVMRRIVKYFPPDRQRMLQVIRLAVLTESFKDVERYYETYRLLSQNDRDAEMVRNICAALVVSGRWFLRNQQTEMGVLLFDHAANTSAARPFFLLEIVDALVWRGQQTRAATYLEKFSKDQQESKEYLSARYALEDSQLSAAESLEKGKQLLAQGVETRLVYRTLVTRAREAQEHALNEQYTTTALAKWPDLAKDLKPEEKEGSSDAASAASPEGQAAS